MGSNKLGDSGMVALTAKIMVVIIIFLFLVVVFMFFIHLYTKWFSRYRQGDHNGGARRRPRRNLDFAGGYQEVNILRRGLDPSVLKTIPVISFNSKGFKDGLECSVCLSEVSEGEKARLLPKCNHGFHVDCIDMWFQSHSTCPLCRNPVSEKSSLNSPTTAEATGSATAAEQQGSASAESTNLPTNVLFWGDETQVSTLGPCLEIPTSSSASTSNRPDGILVIDIPRQTTEEGEEEEEEEEERKTPTRVRSWTRLFSRVTPCSSRSVDVEQGGTGQS